MAMPGSTGMQMLGAGQREAQCPMTAGSHDPIAEVLAHRAFATPAALPDSGSLTVVAYAFQGLTTACSATTSPPRLLALRI